MRSYCVIGAVLALAGTAAADQVRLKTTGLVTGGVARVESSLKGSGAFNVNAGQIKHTVDSSDSSLVSVGDLLTFCTEIAQTTSGSFHDFDIKNIADAPDPEGALGPIGSDKAEAIGRLYHYVVKDLGKDLQSTLDNDFAAAFQLAIWEIVEDFDKTAIDGGLAAGSGDFKVLDFSRSSGTTASGVSTDFDTLIGVAKDTSLSGLRLGALTNPDRQDQIIIIPLPGTAGLAAFGLAGVGLAARRRRG